MLDARDLIFRFAEPLRYVLLSAAIYSYIFILLGLSDFLLDINPRVSYAVILASAYVIDYAITGRWVFGKNLGWRSIARFIIFVSVSYFLNVVLFLAIYTMTSLAVVSAMTVAVILFLPRYYLSKTFVYRN